MIRLLRLSRNPPAMVIHAAERIMSTIGRDGVLAKAGVGDVSIVVIVRRTPDSWRV